MTEPTRPEPGPSLPQAFVPRPLCTTPQAVSGVPIHAYVTGRGIDWSQPTETRDFAGIDVDAWASDLFAAIDRLLEPPLALPAAVLGAKDGQDYLAPFRDARRRLAASLRTLAIPLFATSEPGADTQQAAQDAFEQSLLARLSSAFDPVGPGLLRTPPAPPAMVVQTAHRAAPAAAPDAPALASAAASSAPLSGPLSGPLAAWDFSFTYGRSQHPAQDLIQGKVRFNRHEARAAKGQPGKEKMREGDAPRGASGGATTGSAAGGTSGGRTDSATSDLLRDLARFVVLFPVVAQDLARWVAPLDGATTDETALVNARAALQSASALVSRIVDRWTTFPDPPADAGAMRGGADAYGFSIRERDIAIDDRPALLVSILGGGPPGTGEPRIEIEGYTAVPHPVAGGYGYVYVRAADGARLDRETARAITHRTLVLPGLDARARQDACASLQVVRNAALVDDPAILTAEPFVYRTDWVRFPNAIEPTTDRPDIDPPRSVP